MNRKELMDCLDNGYPLFISADNEVLKRVEPVNGRDFKLQELYKLLGVLTIETVELFNGSIMVLDEEGKLKDDRVVNKFATALFRVNRMTEKKMREMLKSENVIAIINDTELGLPENSVVGNVLVCNRNYIL